MGKFSRLGNELYQGRKSYDFVGKRALWYTISGTLVGLAIVVILSFVWTTAERSSHQAVQTAQATLSRTYVTLPRVEIVGKREAVATPVAVRATAKRQG